MLMQALVEVLLICLAVPTLTSSYPMTTGYPVYGTKRYNRPSSSVVRSASLAPSWRQPPSPVRYYPDQPYSDPQQQEEASSYFYYPDGRRRRYQQQYMYYPRYPVSDPVEDLEDTMRREEEGWYDDGDDTTLLRPMGPSDYYPAYYAKYNSRPRQQQSYFPEDYYDNPYDWYRPQQVLPQRNFLDESHEDDFKDSKSVQGSKHFEKSPYDYLDADDEDDAWINWGSKRSSTTNSKTKSVAPSGTSAPGTIGQKEIVQPRPAIQPFRMPEILDDEDGFYHEKRSTAPGVYDTIRRLIAMEKDLEQQTDKKAPLKKRFVASGEDFVQELNSLKKRRA